MIVGRLMGTSSWRTVIALQLVVGCAATDRPGLEEEGLLSDNATLIALFEEDQADRSGGGDAIDWTVVSVSDSLRRERVLGLVDSGLVVTSADYYHAAMVFQHGADTTAARMAYDLSQRAVKIDPTNADAKWLLAAAWDRYKMRLGEPQWYGTQYVRENDDDPWELYPVDTTAVSDEERLWLGVPDLEESRARVVEMNRGRN